MPAVVISHLVNTPATAVHLPGTRPLVLLDFFATSCSSCVAALPRLDSLQKKFGDRLQVLVVTAEAGETLQKFLLRNTKARGVQLPFVYADTTLAALFPHELLPHEVWLSGGVVTAITDADQVTETNISAILEGKSQMLTPKADNFVYDRHLPLTANLGLPAAGVLSQSILVPAIPGVQSGVMIGRDSSHVRLTCINVSEATLFETATGLLDTTLRSEALYCFEVTAPLNTSLDSLHAVMLQQLTLYFRRERTLFNQKK